MIEDFYRDFRVSRILNQPGFATEPIEEVVGTIRGCVQTPSSRLAYILGKANQTIDGVLFCSLEDARDIKVNDRVADLMDGIRYIVSNGAQPLGVSGVVPSEGQHCEFYLVYDNDS